MMDCPYCGNAAPGNHITECPCNPENHNCPSCRFCIRVDKVTGVALCNERWGNPRYKKLENNNDCDRWKIAGRKRDREKA